MYIKFPKFAAQKTETTTAQKTIVVEEKQDSFAKHTISCQKFLPDSVKTPQPKIIKPMGVDDGFKGDAAACGQSVVAVAQQMLASKPNTPRGFTTDDAPEKPSNGYLRRRRNSKSLPASPVATPETSPRSRRKNNTAFALQNRFFTGPFVATEKTLNESEENLEKKSGSSWLLTGLFTSHRENAATKNEQNIVAADSEPPEVVKKEREEKSVVDSSSEANVTNVTVKVKAAPAPASRPSEKVLFKPKPSELREMNFWSPTSM